MDENKIIAKLEECQIGEIEKGITMYENLHYENEYIELIRIDSSNKWLGIPHHSDMSKQWGIIIKLKKQFVNLDGYKHLQKHFHVDVTPVVKGVNKGCFGIRFYGMKKNPTLSFVENLLDFIFEK